MSDVEITIEGDFEELRDLWLDLKEKRQERSGYINIRRVTLAHFDALIEAVENVLNNRNKSVVVTFTRRETS